MGTKVMTNSMSDDEACVNWKFLKYTKGRTLVDPGCAFLMAPLKHWECVSRNSRLFNVV